MSQLRKINLTFLPSQGNLRVWFFSLVLFGSCLLAVIDLYKTFLLFQNYDSPPSIIPYPVLINYLSFSLSVPLFIWLDKKVGLLTRFKELGIQLIVALFFVTTHIYISNISDWFFYDREWTIGGSFSFVFTSLFMQEVVIYGGLLFLYILLKRILPKENEKDEGLYLTKIEVKKGSKILFIEADQIDWIEANDNYINIHSDSKTYLLRQKLKQINDRLDPNTFQQIHRSTIVNLAKVHELELHSDGGCLVHLTNGNTLKATKTYRESLKNRLS